MEGFNEFPIQIQRQAPDVAWVTLSRPEALNALSGPMLDGLLHTTEDLAKDPALRVIVLTGAGPRAFCAGADLKERLGMSEADTNTRIDLYARTLNAWATLPQITIAALNGVTFGGGLELALTCDLRIAVETAQLGLTEARLGIIPGAGGTQRLPRIIGIAHAKEMILLGQRISAQRAGEIGLVHQVVATTELNSAIEQYLREIRSLGPLALSLAKQAIDRGMDVPLEEGLRIERALYEKTLTTDDRVEGLRAFAEKRTPQFIGR